jgi:hypothetical protein
MIGTTISDFVSRLQAGYAGRRSRRRRRWSPSAGRGAADPRLSGMRVCGDGLPGAVPAPARRPPADKFRPV